MIGYSDSNKDRDSGEPVGAAHKAQAAIASAATTHGARIRFFHGRGVLISREQAQRTAFWALYRMARFRETFASQNRGKPSRRSSRMLSQPLHNLELFLAGVTAFTVMEKQAPAPENSIEEICRSACDRQPGGLREAHHLREFRDVLLASYADDRRDQ